MCSQVKAQVGLRLIQLLRQRKITRSDNPDLSQLSQSAPGTRANPQPLNDAAPDRRISFDHDANIMEADFSNFSFTDSRIVNAFYDAIGRRISESGRDKWFFLANYRNCEVHLRHNGRHG